VREGRRPPGRAAARGRHHRAATTTPIHPRLDRRAGVVHVRRVYTDGAVKLYGKQGRSLRAVPVPSKALEALSALPTGIGSTLLFSGDKGGHLNLHEWRRDVWTPALKAAGLAHRPYALRHTYASFSIAAGVSPFELARFMGTSVDQIDQLLRAPSPRLDRPDAGSAGRVRGAFGRRVGAGGRR
jgi:integrase